MVSVPPSGGRRKAASGARQGPFFCSAVFSSLPSPVVSVPPSGETKASIIRSQAGPLFLLGCFFSLPSPVVSVPPSGETKASIIRSQAGPLFLLGRFFVSTIPGGFDSPFRGTKEGRIRNVLRAPFFFQKGPSCKTSPRDILQFTPENAPYGKESFALCGRPGSSLPLRSAPWLCATGTRRPRQAEPGRNPRLQRGRTTT